jgi:hypothetical protein
MGFALPALLLALVVLPAVWWFIRHLPPAPRKVPFPALALLRPLAQTTPPPRTPPLWLLILRLLMVAILIVLLAEPFLRKGEKPTYINAPFVVVLESDWRAAPHWEASKRLARTVIETARNGGHKVLLVPTADADRLLLTTADEALQRLERLSPRPWPARAADAARAAAGVMQAAGSQTANVVWLSSGLTDNTETLTDTLRALGEMGQAHVYLPQPEALPTMLTAVRPTEHGVSVTLWHPTRRPVSAVSLYDVEGRFITRGLPTDVPDGVGATEHRVNLTIPSTLSGAGVLRLDGENHLGAWFGVAQMRGIPRIGLMTTPNPDFPLLSGTYYLEHALAPLGTPRQMTGETPLDGFNMILLDHQPADVDDLRRWVQQGGVLVTFAGPWLENNRALDDLLPVRLRPRPRELAGPLSWSGALKLGATRPDTPLQNLTLPPDVHVTTQFLPENAPEVSGRIWLALEDDTPLVTGRREGNGYVVLVHVSADVRWSSLPLSGFYVEMLSGLINLARGHTDEPPAYPLPPFRLVDAFGNPRPLPETLTILQADSTVSRDAPVGFYGPAGTPVAHNLLAPQRRGVALSAGDLRGLDVRTYAEGGIQTSLQPYLAALLALLLVLDTLARSWRVLSRRLGLAALTLAFWAAATPVQAQDFLFDFADTALEGQLRQDPAFATQIAWIPSGNDTVDTLTESGLTTLSNLLRFRTTIEAAQPKKLDLESDDLGFYPLIYWAVIPNPRPLTVQAAEKLRAYMQNGGLLVLDNQTELGLATRATELIMNQIVRRPLIELRDTHVLGRSYYLLRGQYPGRVTGRPVWIENTNTTAAILVGSHDWAAGWATAPNGAPLRPTVPGGDTQRTLSLRFGINLVMYALLGDYKADQLHIDALLTRMREDGQ